MKAVKPGKAVRRHCARATKRTLGRGYLIFTVGASDAVSLRIDGPVDHPGMITPIQVFPRKALNSTSNNGMSILVDEAPVESAAPSEGPFLEPSNPETKRWIEEVFFLYVDEK
jgi:hypothetical protein